MTKHLVTIEFRYNDVPKYDRDSGYTTKNVTVGVYDTIEEAIIEGNKKMEIFEKHFKLNIHHNKKERFSKTGFLGTPNTLISDIGYLFTPFSFFAKISKLHYLDVEETILEVLQATKKYKEFKLKQVNNLNI